MRGSSSFRPDDLAFASGLVFLQKRQSGLSESFGPHDFALVSHSFPNCLPLHSGFSFRMISGLCPTCVSVYSGCSEYFDPHDFALVSHLCRSVASIISGLFPSCLHLSPLSALVPRVSQHTLNICLYDFRFVSLHNLDALSAFARMISYFPPTCRRLVSLHSGFSARIPNFSLPA